MIGSQRSPIFKWHALILVALSLSIGWGIRGNFGHEYGAMIPGALGAMALCLVAEREDWLSRLPYFAIFGALGWAFGGSMSYMKVVNYTQSGHLPSIIYGFGGLFLGGFLWSAMGVAGTAFAAIEQEDRLQRLFRPLLWVFVFWAAYYFLWEPVMNKPLIVSLTGGRVTGPERGLFREMRQNDPFYWLDSDWVPAFLALVAVCFYDLFSRRSKDIAWLPIVAFVGAGFGFILQVFLERAGILDFIKPVLVRVQGDLTALSPETGKPFEPQNMVTNWPSLFARYQPYMGAVLGTITGAALYFYRYGKWKNGAVLLLYMSLGWFLVFITVPVLLGIRMTPPRNDNWAGVLGVLIGLFFYCLRHDLKPVPYASLVGGTIGGFGIAFTQCLKLLLIAPGNPNRLAGLPDDVREPILRAWEHWQNANWHSIVIEQGVGIIYGLGVAVALGILANRLPENTPRGNPLRHWTSLFSVFFVLAVVVYLNMVKNVTEFTKLRGPGEAFRCVPETMKAPFVESLELSTRTWFNLAFLLYAICSGTLLLVHRYRKKIALVPENTLGKGQLLYLVFLWIVTTFNFEKALVGFHEQRLGTEGIIFVNAIIVTFLATATTDTPQSPSPDVPVKNASPLSIRKALLFFCATALFCILIFPMTVRAVYKDRPAGAGAQGGKRFGEQAEWRLYPIVRDREHR